MKKKTVKATTKSKYPGKEDAIDFEQVKKDLAIGKEIHKADLGIGKGKYYYSVNYGSCKDQPELDMWMIISMLIQTVSL